MAKGQDLQWQNGGKKGVEDVPLLGLKQNGGWNVPLLSVKQNGSKIVSLLLP